MNDPLAFARRIALAKLATRAHSRAELEAALQKKNVPGEVIEELLGRFGEVGLIDDAQFAADWVRSRHERKHVSRSVLKRELRARGVGEDEIAEALSPIDGESELAAARAIAQKKAAAMTHLDEQVRTRRLAAALARRGFGSGVIASVLGELR
ncbi:MAG: regulatory protein RecX [Propionibacteriaceae bacterium]|nr:regulatory protein RecX [Propionibacteriaceae bacterium]